MSLEGICNYCNSPLDISGVCRNCKPIKRPFNLLSEDELVKEMGKGGQADDNIARLVPTKSDAEVAEEFKQKLIEAHDPLLKILTELDKLGFASQVQCGKNGLGKFQIMQLQIMKIY